MAQVVTTTPFNVARTVRERRLALGWSQEALAARMTALGVGWHQTTVAKVESSTRPRTLSAQEVVALTLALGLPRIEDLFGPRSGVPQAVGASFKAANQRQVQRSVEFARRVFGEVSPDALTKFDELIASAEAQLAERQQQGEHEATAFAHSVAAIDQMVDQLNAILATTEHEHRE